MTADVELLPLPEPLPRVLVHVPHEGDMELEAVGNYYAADQVRACVVHATAAKDAEIEALRAEVERLTQELQKAPLRRLQETSARAERLAEALRWYVENDDTNEGQEGNEFWLAGRDRAIAVLRDYDQKD